MSWQILLLINLIAASAREFISKKIANKNDPAVSLAYIACFVFVNLLLLHFYFQKSLPRFNIEASISGIVFVIAFIAYWKAMKISLSQSILFSSYSILITVFLAAIFLGEWKYINPTTISGLKTIGGTLLAVISLRYLLSERQNKIAKLEKKWFYFILINIILLGIGSFFSIYYLRVLTPIEVLINQSYSMIPLFIIVAILQKSRLILDRKAVIYTFLNALFSTIAVVAFFQMLVIVPAAKVLPLQQLLLVLVTMLNGFVFFKETNLLKGQRKLGMLFGFIGIIFLISAS